MSPSIAPLTLMVITYWTCLTLNLSEQLKVMYTEDDQVSEHVQNVQCLYVKHADHKGWHSLRNKLI